MKIKKSILLSLLREAFQVSEPAPGTDEMLSPEHQMMTILVRKIYKNLDDPEMFFRNLSIIEDAMNKSSNIQGDIARKFFTLETILGNLQKIHEGQEVIIDIDSSGQQVEYDEFGMPISPDTSTPEFDESDDFDSEVPSFEDDDADMPF